MFAAYHRLGNMVVIVDDNNRSMLGNQDGIAGLRPIDRKFSAFGWKSARVDGHDVKKLYQALSRFSRDTGACPKVLVARTIKGKGVPELEKDPICHVKSLTRERIAELIAPYEE
jgi:transketolase